jgi:NTE family protein
VTLAQGGSARGALLALVLLLAAPALAAPGTPPEAGATSRPRMGLVLSGGGARGAAHIGVLEVLEELRVPVDVVSGTSMGSVVGGLYAAGLSPEELSAAIQGIDWVKVFDDKPDRQELSFRRKQDDRNFLTNLRLGFKDWRFFIPTGLVEGQKLDFILRSLTLNSDGVALIEDLQLPFRAVATDIATGEAVVFDEGELAVAQRASMSIPAAFSPVEIDGRMLVDGFVANNLPIDVAQGMGAEAVIAVDVSTPISTREELTSAIAIQGQVGTFPVQESQRLQIERLHPGDVLLTPALGDLSSASFPKMPEAIEAGRKVARANAERLARYSVSEEEYAAWRARHRRPPVEIPVVDRIRLDNRSLLADAVIRPLIHTREGERLDLDVLSDDLGHLFGMDAFERVQFDLQREAEGMVLTYRLDARQRGRHYFRVGLNLEADLANEATFNLAVNQVSYPVNSWGAEIRTLAQFGDVSTVQAEFYQPLDPRDWFFAQPFARYELTDVDVFQGGKRVARFDLETVLAGVDLGVNLGNFLQLRAAIAYLDGETDRESGDPAVFGGTKFSGGLYQAVLEYDTLDNTRFPNDGAFLRVDGTFVREELGFDGSFEQLRGAGLIARTFRRNTLALSLKYTTAFGGGNRVQVLNALGGFGNLSAFERGSIVGKTTGLARLNVYRRIASPAIFAWEFPVYAGVAFETGNAWQKRGDIDDDLLWSTGPFFGIDTPLGPLYIAYAHGEGGEDQGYIFLGKSF